MKGKHLLAIGIISLVIVLLFTVFNSSMHIMTRNVRAAFSRRGTARHRTFESAVAIATDVVVAEFVAQRPFGQRTTEFEFIVHERIFGNAADTIFVYLDDSELTVTFIDNEQQFTRNTQYLLTLIKLADVYSPFHDDAFMFLSDLTLDLNNPSRSTMHNEPLWRHSRIDFGSRFLTRRSIISYVSALPWNPSPTWVFITSSYLEDIIDGSPNVLVVEINEPTRLADVGTPIDTISTDIYFTTVVEVLKGDMQIGDVVEIVFFAGTVFPGETHIVSVAPVSTASQNPYFQQFTSRHSLHSPDQLDEIVSIINGNTP